MDQPDLDAPAAEAMLRRGLERKANGTPTQKTQRNFTDTDSHLQPKASAERQKSHGHNIQGYNYQPAVDSDHPVIMALGVSNQPPDVKHLEPQPQVSVQQLVRRIAATAGALPEVLTTDVGYWSEDNAKSCAEQGMDAYIATGRFPHGQPLPPKCGPMPRDAHAKARIARALRSKAGSVIQAQRKAGLIKSQAEISA